MAVSHCIVPNPTVYPCTDMARGTNHRDAGALEEGGGDSTTTHAHYFYHTTPPPTTLAPYRKGVVSEHPVPFKPAGSTSNPEQYAPIASIFSGPDPDPVPDTA